MTLIVSEPCQRLGMRAQAVIFRGLAIGSGNVELRGEIADEAERVRGRYADAEAIRDDAAVRAFADLLRRVGVNPRREKPSLEKLLGFAHKRGALPAINDLVDAYNLVSIRSGCSMGAHDLDRLLLPVSLRFLMGTESFTPLGEAASRPVDSREFGYVDAAERVLCRLDILQADFSKVTTATRNVFLIVEATDRHDPEALPSAVAQAQALIPRFCGGSIDGESW